METEAVSERLKQAEERNRQLARVVARLEATAEIARAVGGETNMDRVLETIVRRARSLVEARAVAILLLDGHHLEVAEVAGELDPDVCGERLPASTQISPEDLGTHASDVLRASLTFRGSRLGVIVAFDRIGPTSAFDEEDDRLLAAFAASAAAAVSTAKSVAEERLRHSIEASERERQRWAHELHDDTLQALGAMRVVLASAMRSGSQEVLRGTVERAVEQLGDGISALRGLIAELRPAALDELGLGAAIEGLVEQQAAAGEFEIEAEVTIADAAGSEQRLEPELESALYRVVQEALTNVVKHAQAETVAFALRETDGRIEVVVRDDGRGFDTTAEPGDGFGMLGMRERIELAGGELDVSSEPGEGTGLRAWVPVRRPQASSRFRSSA
jgi:signal transduction histidine kinase